MIFYGENKSDRIYSKPTLSIATVNQRQFLRRSKLSIVLQRTLEKASQLFIQNLGLLKLRESEQAKHQEMGVSKSYYYFSIASASGISVISEKYLKWKPHLVGNRDSQDLQQLGRFGGAIWTSHCLSFSSAKGSPGCLTSGFWWEENNIFYYNHRSI